MVTVADPEEFGFAVETALTVTGVVVTLPFPLEVVGTPLGATKRPDVEIKPVAWLPPVTPLTSHVTAVLDCPFTVAVNCWVVKMATLIGFGVTVTETGGGGGALAPPHVLKKRRAPRPPEQAAALRSNDSWTSWSAMPESMIRSCMIRLRAQKRFSRSV